MCDGGGGLGAGVGICNRSFNLLKKLGPTGAVRAKSFGSAWGTWVVPACWDLGCSLRELEPHGGTSCPSWISDLIPQQHPSPTHLPRCKTGPTHLLKTGHLGECLGSLLLSLGGCCNEVPRPTLTHPLRTQQNLIMMPIHTMHWLGKGFRTRTL